MMRNRVRIATAIGAFLLIASTFSATQATDSAIEHPGGQVVTDTFTVPPGEVWTITADLSVDARVVLIAGVLRAVDGASITLVADEEIAISGVVEAGAGHIGTIGGLGPLSAAGPGGDGATW